MQAATVGRLARRSERAIVPVCRGALGRTEGPGEVGVRVGPVLSLHLAVARARRATRAPGTLVWPACPLRSCTHAALSRHSTRRCAATRWCGNLCSHSERTSHSVRDPERRRTSARVRQHAALQVRRIAQREAECTHTASAPTGRGSTAGILARGDASAAWRDNRCGGRGPQ